MSEDNQNKALNKCPYCASVVPDQALKCAQCGEYVKRPVGFLFGVGIFFFPLLFVWFTLRKGYSDIARLSAFAWLMVAFILFFALDGTSSSRNEFVSSNDTYQQSTGSSTASVSPRVSKMEVMQASMPDQEKQLINIVDKYVPLYEQANNELKKSKVWKERGDELNNMKPSIFIIKDWVGVIEDMGTNSEGKAYVSIRINERITVKTWNNAFSDIGDNTLISQSSPLYSVLAELEEGSLVKFSAKTIQTANLTEEGKMMDPEILARFSSIKPI